MKLPDLRNLTGWRLAVGVLMVFLILGFVGGTIWWFFIRPASLQTAATVAKVDAAAANVQTGNAVDAIKAGTDQTTRIEITREITRENTTRIVNAEGAGDAVPPAVWREFLAAVCLRRQATRSDPACANVPGADRADAGQEDAVRPPAG